MILGSDTLKSYIIVDKQTKTPIGITSLIQIDLKSRNAECIIDIGAKEYWGKWHDLVHMGILSQEYSS